MGKLRFSLSPRMRARVLSDRTIRRILGSRRVMRNVQGVWLAMPWSHRLPDYANRSPNYGQNLVDLAVGLGETDTPLGVIDVGANIGDSALQILARVDARVICVEADPEYLPYLERNIGSDGRCVIEHRLLVTDITTAFSLGAVRKDGTTRFAKGGRGGVAAPMTVGELQARHSELPPIRLIKSDTDGFDTTLIPSLARAYEPSCPVLFFEYDPDLTRWAGVSDPSLVWAELQTLGYVMVGIWDNFGKPIEVLPINQVAAKATVLDKSVADRGYNYWDVAVVHARDTSGMSSMQRLFSRTVRQGS